MEKESNEKDYVFGSPTESQESSEELSKYEQIVLDVVEKHMELFFAKYKDDIFNAIVEKYSLIKDEPKKKRKLSQTQK
jgi:hypothetical protein